MTKRDEMLAADVGCWIKIKEHGADEEEVYQLANQTDALRNKLAPDNTMGQALIGARPGDEVTVRGRSGPIRFEVLDVRRDDPT